MSQAHRHHLTSFGHVNSLMAWVSNDIIELTNSVKMSYTQLWSLEQDIHSPYNKSASRVEDACIIPLTTPVSSI